MDLLEFSDEMASIYHLPNHVSVKVEKKNYLCPQFTLIKKTMCGKFFLFKQRHAQQQSVSTNMHIFPQLIFICTFI